MNKGLADQTKADRVEEMFRKGEEAIERRDRETGRRMVTELCSSFEFHYRDVRFEQMGDAVVFLSTMELKGCESGVEVERELGVVYPFEDDLIRCGWAYDTHAAAFAAAQELAR